MTACSRARSNAVEDWDHSSTTLPAHGTCASGPASHRACIATRNYRSAANAT